MQALGSDEGVISMSSAVDPSCQLVREHQALLLHCASAQTRCSSLIQSQAQEIDRLQAQIVRLRASVVMCETALAWERENRTQACMAMVQPGHASALLARMQALVQARWLRTGPAVGRTAIGGV